MVFITRNIFSILFIGLSVFYMGDQTAFAENSIKWGVGVDVPLHYSSKFKTGRNGIIIEGIQDNVGKGSRIRYEIVERGFWSDKTYDKIEITNDGSFTAKLNAPPGKEYCIKIYGYGNLAFGELTITPY